MWIITCECGHKAPMDDYEPSCADECTCPVCGTFFQFERPKDEDGPACDVAEDLSVIDDEVI